MMSQKSLHIWKESCFGIILTIQTTSYEEVHIDYDRLGIFCLRRSESLADPKEAEPKAVPQLVTPAPSTRNVSQISLDC